MIDFLSTWGPLGSVFTASLLGSLHCVGMCGCLASATGTRGHQALGLYHFGRLVGYSALGAGAGALGSGMDRLGANQGINHLAAWAMALLMVATLITPLRRWRPPGLTQGIEAVLRRLRSPQHSNLWALTVGLASALLPCGWLYTYVAVAVGAGTPGAGAAVMAAFWLGTVPALTSGAWLSRGLQRILPPVLRPYWTPLLVAVAAGISVSHALSDHRPSTCAHHAGHHR